VAVELVTEEAVLGVIDDWWRRASTVPVPLKAAQITLRLNPQVHRAADAAVLVPQVVGRIRDLARRGRVRALPDGSAVLSYSPLLTRPAGSRPRDLTALVGARAGLPTWGAMPRPAEAPVAPRPAAPPAARWVHTPRPAAPAVRAGATGHPGVPDLSPRTRRLIIRLVVVVFLLITTAVVASVGRLIDLPIRSHSEISCSDTGRASSSLPPCGGHGGR
jgi:hypothetical protein